MVSEEHGRLCRSRSQGLHPVVVLGFGPVRSDPSLQTQAHVSPVSLSSRAGLLVKKQHSYHKNILDALL